MYGLKQSGYDERDAYRHAASVSNQLNRQEGALLARGHGENLRATMAGIGEGRRLEADTWGARSMEAEGRLRDVRNQGGALASRAFDYAQRSGDWGGFQHALAGIGSQQSAARDRIGALATQQFRSPTLANAGRRYQFGQVMDAANVRDAAELRSWAALAIGAEDRAAQRLLEADRMQYTRERDALNDVYRYDQLGQREEAQRAQSKYRAGRDEIADTRRDRESLLKAQDTLLKRGHSPEAIDAYSRGDDRLVQEELRSGKVGPLSGGGTGKSGAGKKGGAGVLTRAEQMAQDPLKHRDYLQARLGKLGYGTEFLGDRVRAGAFYDAYALEFERTGDMDEALGGALRFAAPEEYAGGVFGKYELNQQGLLTDKTRRAFVEGVDATLEQAPGLKRVDAEALVLAEVVGQMPASGKLLKNKTKLTKAAEAAKAKVEALAAQEAEGPSSSGLLARGADPGAEAPELAGTGAGVATAGAPVFGGGRISMPGRGEAVLAGTGAGNGVSLPDASREAFRERLARREEFTTGLAAWARDPRYGRGYFDPGPPPSSVDEKPPARGRGFGLLALTAPGYPPYGY